MPIHCSLIPEKGETNTRIVEAKCRRSKQVPVPLIFLIVAQCFEYDSEYRIKSYPKCRSRGSQSYVYMDQLAVEDQRCGANSGSESILQCTPIKVSYKV